MNKQAEQVIDNFLKIKGVIEGAEPREATQMKMKCLYLISSSYVPVNEMTPEYKDGFEHGALMLFKMNGWVK